MLKKLSTLFVLSIFMSSAHAQINPVKNLTLTQSYSTPYNCYSLSWSPPDSVVTDTLVGYNIYRDSIFYRFTTNAYQNCNPCIGDTTMAYCGNFYNYKAGHFTVYVNAVYNKAHTESAHTDVVEFQGLATRVKEVTKDFSFTAWPNPASTIVTIKSETLLNNAVLILYDTFGKQVKQIKNIHGKSLSIQRENLPEGLYFLYLTQENSTFKVAKVLFTGN